MNHPLISCPLSIIYFISLLVLSSCSDNSAVENKNSSSSNTIVVDGVAIKYAIVNIDGTDYFASRTYAGNYVIGGKVEKKKDK